MTQEEQRQVDQLQEQLEGANQNLDDIREYFSRALCQLTCEARLYRGLFWCLLACATAAAIFYLLQR